MTSSSIKDYSSVLNLLQDRKYDLETFSTYAPSNRFLEAVVTGDYLSFSVKDEDGSIFAMALGESPEILECDRLATSRGVKVDESRFKHQSDWDFYSIDTNGFFATENADVASDSEEIGAFLKEHAPNSSVWPGDPEVLFWGEIRTGNNLVAIGALVQWRTGQIMFASIATHIDHRGKGLAQTLVRQMLARVAKSGVAHVGLGVFAGNVSAKRAYENVGFNLVKELSSYTFVGN